jgi:hypothetical protein
MWKKGALVGVLVGLMTVPAGAFYVGYAYEDGSDAIFGGLPDVRSRFEVTLADELHYLGATDTESETADFKGLVHPLYANGETDKDTVCGWVRGFGEITHREFRPFMYSVSAPLARIVGHKGEGLDTIKDRCGVVLDLG